MLIKRISFNLLFFILNLYSIISFSQNYTKADQISPKFKKMYSAAIQESRNGEYEKSLKTIENILNA